MVVALLMAAACRGDDVAVWLTRGDGASLLEARPALVLQQGAGSNSTKITIDPTVTYQTIDGFGAAVTDSSARLIQYELSAVQRDALLDNSLRRTLASGSASSECRWGLPILR